MLELSKVYLKEVEKVGKRWLGKKFLAKLAKRSAGILMAVGLVIGGLSIVGNAGSTTTPVGPATLGFGGDVGPDGMWTMPSEVTGTYCVNFNDAETPLDNMADDNFTYTIPANCSVCKGSTVTMKFDCAGIAATGCSAQFYLVYQNPDNATDVSKVATATVPSEDCDQPVSQLNFIFDEKVDNATNATTLYLSTEPDTVVSPTMCFTDQCKISDFLTTDGKLPSGSALACLDAAKVNFANRVEQFHINNVVGPRKDVIALNGMCPRSHFAGSTENVYGIISVDKDGNYNGILKSRVDACCSNGNSMFSSTDWLKICDYYDTDNNDMEDPINPSDVALNFTLASNNPNNLKAIESVVLNGETKYPFTLSGNEYVLDNVSIWEGGKLTVLNDCQNGLTINIGDKCPGTLLEDGDFTLNTQFVFNPDAINYTNYPGYMNATISHPDVTLLTHHWVLEGWEGIVPYMSTYTGYTSFIKVFNDYTKAANVYVDIFPDNGNPIYNVKIGTVPAKQVKLFKAADIETLAGQNLTFFAMRIIVDAPPAFVHAITIQKSPTGDRVIPIDKASSYKGQMLQFEPAGKGGLLTE